MLEVLGPPKPKDRTVLVFDQCTSAPRHDNTVRERLEALLQEATPDQYHSPAGIATDLPQTRECAGEGAEGASLQRFVNEVDSECRTGARIPYNHWIGGVHQ